MERNFSLFVSWNLNFLHVEQRKFETAFKLGNDTNINEKFKNSLADGMTRWVKARAAKPE